MKDPMKSKILYGFQLWSIVVFQLEIITRGNGDPYLKRFTIIKTPWFGVFIHNFQGSDDLCLHDHPWSFLTWVIAGGYWEVTPKGRKWVAPGELRARLAPYPHRVEAVGSWTFVISGPTKRKWGFHTPSGWIHWRKYVQEVHCNGQI